MKKSLIAAALGASVLFSAAYAQDEAAATSPMKVLEPSAQFADCKLYETAPVMPDPKTATAEERSATVAKIQAFQGKLNEYRECLNAFADNEENDVEQREEALKEFNRTVKVETDMVKDWQKFSKKYDKANK